MSLINQGKELHRVLHFKLIVFYVNCNSVFCCVTNLCYKPWMGLTLPVNPGRMCNKLSGIILRNSPQEDTESKYFQLKDGSLMV